MMDVERIKALLGASIESIEPDASFSGVTAATIPCAVFADAAAALKKAGFRLVAEWSSDETPLEKGFFVFAAYNRGKDYLVIKSALGAVSKPSFPTLTAAYPSAYRFERRILSLMGVTPAGHPDLRVWIKHEDWPEDAFPLRKSFDAGTKMARTNGTYRWIRGEGEGVFEIAVGPVHAGIIEPGHFRFQALGEDIINLEERLGYVHKGIEKRFEQLDYAAACRLAGRVSGDTTVAHSMAYCMAAEAAAHCVVPERGAYMRAALLERERIANHLGDIGAIANDAAFTFLLYQTAILREKILKTNKRLFGHRLTMDAVIPGGVSVDIDAKGIAEIIEELHVLSGEFERLVSVYDENPSLEDRVCDAGTLKTETAVDLGTVGFVARASGVEMDARVLYPVSPYDKLVPNVPVFTAGDVNARVWVRIEEVRESIRLVRELLNHIPRGPVASACPAPLAGSSGFSAVEGWRGEIIYSVTFGHGGSITRCMVRDPSDLNWLALEQAIHGNIVPDFPLCNKSFNQSYSGNDL